MTSANKPVLTGSRSDQLRDRIAVCEQQATQAKQNGDFEEVFLLLAEADDLREQLLLLRGN